MKHKIDIYLESFNLDTKKDIQTRLSELNGFITVLIELTDNICDSNVQFEFWKQYFEVLIVKFTLISASLSHIIQGTPISKDGNNINYPDLGSIYLLARGQIENYLMFYYLNIQPKSDTEGQFRYYLYELSGLQQRQAYPTSEKYNSKKILEREQINDLIIKIQTTDFFKNLPPKEQKKVSGSKVNARLLGWESLIKESHLKDELFGVQWKLYSNYAHSEMISAIQIKAYVKDHDQMNDAIYLVVRLAIALVCVSINDVRCSSRISEIIPSTNSSETLTKIEMWNSYAKKTT